MPTQDPKVRAAEMMEKANKMKMDYESVFTSEAGLRVLEDLKKSSFFYMSSFTPDSMQTAHNEGARRLVLHIEAMSKVAPEAHKQTAITE